MSSGFAIEGPSQAKIECEDQNDGSCDVCYWPTEPGEYAVHVTCDEQDIEHSPFMAYILPDDNTSDPDKVSNLLGLTGVWCCGSLVLARNIDQPSLGFVIDDSFCFGACRSRLSGRGLRRAAA